MTAFILGTVAAVGIAFGSHFLLTERPDLIEPFVPWIVEAGSSAEKFSSPNVRL